MPNKKPIPVLLPQKEACCGCTACYAVCPANAVVMRADQEGFLYPVINRDACLRCGRCLAVCGFKADQAMRGFSAGEAPAPEDGGYKKGQFLSPDTYAVKHRDETVRAASRSGGVFTALSDRILAAGGAVYGCALEDNRRAVHIRAETAAQRDRMRGSKYIQSEMNGTFASVRRDLEAGREVLFSGTSCQVAGLRRYLGRPWPSLVCVDIVCHGVPSPLVWSDYLDWQEKRNGGRAVAVDFRDKEEFGWKAHVESLRLDNGKKVRSEVFKKLFYGHAILRPCCYRCPYKDVIHPGDVTIADYWGVDEAAPGFNDDKGVSLVLINNEKGRALFDAVKDGLQVVQTRLEDSMQPPLKAPFPRPAGRDAIWKDFFRYPFARFVKRRVEPTFFVRLEKTAYRLLKKALKK